MIPSGSYVRWETTAGAWNQTAYTCIAKRTLPSNMQANLTGITGGYHYWEHWNLYDDRIEVPTQSAKVEWTPIKLKRWTVNDRLLNVISQRHVARKQLRPRAFLYTSIRQ